ncbi:MAG: glycosyltransferase family 2 protein [Simkaniaceae bacterium]|nr:glycosyltransferase family 2 protein [Simkaniaceae bacterium]
MDRVKIAIIILNWNGKSTTAECLETLKLQTYQNFEVILVDNGSTDDSVPFFKKHFPEITLIETKENLGFAGGTNVGINHALNHNFDALLLLNNDTIPRKNMLEGFLHMHKEHPKAVLGGRVYVYSFPERFDHIGGNWNQSRGQFDLVAQFFKDDKKTFEEPLECDYVGGCSLFASADIFRRVGPIEEDFFLFWEEVDWCFRAKRAGHPILYCPYARLLHKVSHSFTGTPHKTYFWWRSRLLWVSRNVPPKKRLSLYLFTLFPEMAKLARHYVLKSLQKLVYMMLKKELGEQRRDKLKTYKAGLCGIAHFAKGRFGNAPSWIFEKS